MTREEAAELGLLQHVRWMDLQRNFNLSLIHRYLYVAVPKAANSTVKRHLQEFEIQGTAFKLEGVHERIRSPLLCPFQLPKGLFVEALKAEDFFRFTVVRHPLTRIVSCYLDRVVAPKSGVRRVLAARMGRDVADEITFEDFLQAVSEMRPQLMDTHYRPQVDLICAELIDYHKVVKLESFAEDYPAVLAKLGIDPRQVDLGKNYSPRKTDASARVSELVTPRSAALIERIYAADYAQLGYE